MWQYIGMIVGVYGIGYAVASVDPFRQWPIVLVGFLGKLVDPIGFPHSALTGRLLCKFGMILRGAWRVYLAAPGAGSSGVRDQKGRTVDGPSKDQPFLLVFLGHFGCTFCREALADLRVQRSRIDAAGRESPWST